MTTRALGGQSVNVQAVTALPVDETSDRYALARLYRDHADFLWRTLLRFGIPEAHAEDVAQEVFLVVGRRLHDYDRAAPFKAWLYGIARGVAANMRRSWQRAERRLAVLEPPPRAQTPEEQLERSEAADLVEGFLLTLSPSQREVFVLIDIEGMAGSEVAQALGHNLNSVYSRLRLARARFRAFAAATASPPPQKESV